MKDEILPFFVYSVDEASKIIQTSPRSIRRLCKLNKIANAKVGRSYKIVGLSILNYLNLKQSEDLSDLPFRRYVHKIQKQKEKYGIK